MSRDSHVAHSKLLTLVPMHFLELMDDENCMSLSQSDHKILNLKKIKQHIKSASILLYVLLNMFL